MNRRPSIQLSHRVFRDGWVALVLLAFAAACGGDGADGEEAAADEPRSTEGLTRSLLSDPPERLAQEDLDIGSLGYDAGGAEATIRIIEFSDFGCGYCRKFHEETFPVIQTEYIDEGTVLWKYVPFVIGMFPHGDEAGLAGECAADQGRFEEMRDRLFHDQPEWKGSDDAMPHLYRYGIELGLDAEEFRSCIEEQRPAQRLATSIQAARALGIRGTPTFLINGYPVQGALPIQLFRDIFDQELAAQAAQSDTGN